MSDTPEGRQAGPRPAVPGYHREAPGTHPPLDFPAYRATRLRHPSQPLVPLPHRLTEVTGPLLGEGRVAGADHDLTVQHAGEPLGERIVVQGRVLDGDGRPVPGTLVEVWQANAGGRYRHDGDRHPAPLDPNFSGAGRCLTDAEGRYRFVTIKPGAYPWRNHHNAWRPGPHPLLGVRAGLHPAAGHPDVLPRRPAVRLRPDPRLGARGGPGAAGVPASIWTTTEPEWALGYRWDIVLAGPRGDAAGGRGGRPVTLPDDAVPDHRAVLRRRAALARRPRRWWPTARRARSGSAAGCSTAPASPVPDALVETWQADGQGRFAHPDDPADPPGRASGGSGAARPTPRAAGRSAPSSRARSRPRGPRPPTSTCRCSPGACSPAGDPRLLPRRGRRQRRRPGAGLDRRPGGPGHAGRASPTGTGCASTSACRASGRPSSLPSEQRPRRWAARAAVRRRRRADRGADRPGLPAGHARRRGGPGRRRRPGRDRARAGRRGDRRRLPGRRFDPAELGRRRRGGREPGGPAGRAT